MATTRTVEIHADKASQRGVPVDAFFKFLFPPTLEQPESTGRLDVFGHFGPVDDNGFLRGGCANRHKVCDHEIKKLIVSLNETLLYQLFEPKPKDTVKVVVDEILPKAVSHCYTEKEIKRLISPVAKDIEGRLPFSEVQDIILKDQRRRLLILIDGGSITAETRKQIPFQTVPTKILTRITQKKKLLPPQEFNYKAKLLNGSAALIAPVEMQNLSSQLSNNILLLRGVGSTTDKWDRYCALRQTGKATYVASRNTDTTNKYEEGSKAGSTGGVSDLKTCMILTRNPKDAPKVVNFPPKRQH
ncbi:unnamed protein product [Amoebophrya sp. A120]|nr:unnamed protein product [Amoebophrya sp. A120]|eukprot:GSA120T00015959001.1